MGRSSLVVLVLERPQDLVEMAGEQVVVDVEGDRGRLVILGCAEQELAADQRSGLGDLDAAADVATATITDHDAPSLPVAVVQHVVVVPRCVAPDSYAPLSG